MSLDEVANVYFGLYWYPTLKLKRMDWSDIKSTSGIYQISDKSIVHKKYIVPCQLGGVSEEQPWLRAATRHGPVLLRQDEHGMPQY